MKLVKDERYNFPITIGHNPNLWQRVKGWLYEFWFKYFTRRQADCVERPVIRHGFKDEELENLLEQPYAKRPSHNFRVYRHPDAIKMVPSIDETGNKKFEELDQNKTIYFQLGKDVEVE